MKNRNTQKGAPDFFTLLEDLHSSTDPSKMMTTLEKSRDEKMTYLLRCLYNFEKCLKIRFRLDQLSNIYLAITHEDSKGWFEKPTGSGKSIEISFLMFYFAKISGGEPWIGVLNSPTIELTDQNAKKIIKVFAKSGIDFLLIALHSGTSDKLLERELSLSRIDSVPFTGVLNTTSTHKISRSIKEAIIRKKKILIFSTYDSCWKLKDLKIDLVINDEMQNLVQEKFHDNFRKIKSSITFGWTATPKMGLCSEGRGNNNKIAYGERLSVMSHREAVRLCIIPPYRLHFMDGPIYNSSDVTQSMGKIVKDAYEKHNTLVQIDSSLRRVGKLIVHSKDTSQIQSFLESKEHDELIKKRVTIFAIASNDKIKYRVNGEAVCDRRSFSSLLKEKSEDPESKIIVIHIMILNEGIDVPSLTGGLIMDPASAWYILVQRMGRSGRIDEEDRDKSGGLNIKPYNYIILPNICHEQKEGIFEINNLVLALRSMDDISNLKAHAIGDSKKGINKKNLGNTFVSQGNLISEVLDHFVEEEELHKEEIKIQEMKKILESSPENMKKILDLLD